MYKIVRALLFRMKAEHAHDFLVRVLTYYRYLPFLRNWVRHHYQVDRKSDVIVNGIHFKNRVGLSAGFDKAGVCFDELADFGFGFLELGTITVHPQPGNPKPRIFRLPKDESLISRTGFNNPGLKKFEENLQQRTGNYVVGVNINRDPASEGKDAVADFLYQFQALYNHADYFTINWGSLDAALFEEVLQSLKDYRSGEAVSRPVFIKLPADIEAAVLEQVIDLAHRMDVDGFIATGPTMNRSNLTHYSPGELEKIGPGGVSGKGIGNRSADVVRYLRAHETKHFTIIGAGGIMTEQDVEIMRRAGADLIQIYSAFIYSGPGIVKKMVEVQAETARN